MTYRITIYDEANGDDVDAIFEQRVATLDLKAVFDAINKKPRKPRSTPTKLTEPAKS